MRVRAMRARAFESTRMAHERVQPVSPMSPPDSLGVQNAKRCAVGGVFWLLSSYVCTFVSSCPSVEKRSFGKVAIPSASEGVEAAFRRRLGSERVAASGLYLRRVSMSGRMSRGKVMPAAVSSTASTTTPAARWIEGVRWWVAVGRWKG